LLDPVIDPPAGADKAVRIGERIAFLLGSTRVEVDGGWLQPRVSIGVAWSPPASCTAHVLVGRADSAMRKSRKRRDNRTARSMT
jgi:GGDEF domain-containing protein